ncbi:thiopeptide-type bacteriocin biosynthesis protein [Stenotrophomonas maltophilia]|uniref:thiopeptide-type bacteriocin biosynthesis protein n=1 Tax=Stenotrophomonas maltophilia TaxID=40324 RepID=UPI0007F03D62|nr:thiopeptide-type bacteriocin biosynthesis protein [Stenotrophomonas maltophilia]OBU49741.1 hypothetical protein A9K69_19525 [Stenotrophomonas maltophilia]
MSTLHDPHWVYLRIFPGHCDQSIDAPRMLEDNADALLTRSLLPTLQQLHAAGVIDSYFFLRYAEQGYHLRVRCRATLASQRAYARGALLAALETHLQAAPASFPGARNSAALIADGRIRDSDYAPELDKYAGRAGLDVVETHFRHCSNLAAEAIALVDQGLKRDHLSLWMTGQVLHALGFQGDAAVGLLAGYAQYWMPAGGSDPGQTLQALEDAYLARQRLIAALLPDTAGASQYARTYPHVQKRLGGIGELFADTVAQLCHLEEAGALHSSALPKLRGQTIGVDRCRRHPLACLLIVPNLLHMMNNRIAVNVMTEARLACFAARHYAGAPSAAWSGLPVMLEPTVSFSLHPSAGGHPRPRVDHASRSQE